MKFKIPVVVIIMFLSVCRISGADWKMHPTFDGIVEHVIETPDYVYFTSRVLPENSFFPDSHSLFRYDKEGEEIQPLSTDNLLAYGTVSTIAYNRENGYIAVIYNNFDIDLIYDDGNIVNIPAYRLASVSYPKRVYSVSFAPASDLIFLATEFGYVALNDKKCEVAESCILSLPLLSVAKAGDCLWVIHGDELLVSPYSRPVASLSDFSKVDGIAGAYAIYPLDDDKLLLFAKEEGSGQQVLRIATCSGERLSFDREINGVFRNVEYNRDGLTVSSGNTLLQFRRDGNISLVTIPDECGSGAVSSYDLSQLWCGKEREGIRQYRNAGDSGYVAEGDFISPASPAPFISTGMATGEDGELLVMNFGFDYNFWLFDASSPLLLSGYAYGLWNNYAPAYTNPIQTNVVRRPSGIAVDPDNKDYVYVSSVDNGFARINLRDGTDIIHMSKPSDPQKDLPGFIPVVPDQTGDNGWACRFSAPRFDVAGNLWMSYTDFDNQNPERLHLMCWEADARKSTTSASDFHSPRILEVPGVKPSNVDMLLPLRYGKRRNWIVYSNGVYDNTFVLIDTSGTPLEGDDDRTSVVSSLRDQDGNAVDVHNVRCMWEDPSDGDIWVGHSNGVFHFNPDDFMDGNGIVTRVKIARSDGTNLADYLLNLVTVNNISSDGNGRKWFSTNGGGLVALGSDGRTVDFEFTSENSPLPDNTVYFTHYLPSANSLMISTSGGLVEYFLKSTPSAGEETEVRAYPNPVRPEYIGYVTIDGLPADALVKIVDASGNIIRELSAQGEGEVKWDVTDLHFKRVRSGVYFVLASGVDSSESFSSVSKILVVN